MKNRLLGLWFGAALLAACGVNGLGALIPTPEIAQPLNGYPGFGYTHEGASGIADIVVIKPTAGAFSPCHPNIPWPGESTYKAIGWARSIYFVPLIGYLTKEAILEECEPLDSYMVWWSKAFHWQSRDGSSTTWINKTPWAGWSYFMEQLMSQPYWDSANQYFTTVWHGQGPNEYSTYAWPCHIVVAANHGRCSRDELGQPAYCYDEQAIEFAVKRLNTGLSKWVAPVCLEFDAYHYPTSHATNCVYYVNSNGQLTDYYVNHMVYPPHVHMGYLGMGSTAKTGLFPVTGARAGEIGYPTWKTASICIGTDGVQMAWPNLKYEILHWFDDPTVQNWYGY